MSDSYWRYTDPRQPPPSSIPPLVGKRPRSDYGLVCCSFPSHLFASSFLGGLLAEECVLNLVVVSGGHELSGYYSRDDDKRTMRATRDSDSIGESYDRYVRSTQLSSYSGSQSGRPMSGGMPGRAVDDPRMVGIGGLDPGQTIKDRTIGFGSGRPEPPLPPDASSTLFVEGLPPDCTRREVSHIFRPFVGYKEVRLVTKEPRYAGGDPIKLCFVDFLSPSHAATSMDALQGLVEIKTLPLDHKLRRRKSNKRKPKYEES
ncbi:nuclear speckle RNA-binding protein A-like isoform X2 [Gossypium arboreum]|uniref:nuclear speckle RNA-binding protein A-like isoform X2 n=1 Tax=Gossypium arboreum TaxID=29729 RepID=UPI0022F1B7D5|nr:nuclear speckle RNA-binding protein A-like isoform X2 [Gossypium arboreum]